MDGWREGERVTKGRTRKMDSVLRSACGGALGGKGVGSPIQRAAWGQRGRPGDQLLRWHQREEEVGVDGRGAFACRQAVQIKKKKKTKKGGHLKHPSDSEISLVCQLKSFVKASKF